MLVLARKPSETIIIGGDLFITVGSINNQGVQLLTKYPAQPGTHETRIQVGYSWEVANGIHLHVIEARGDVIKLGIDAPRHIAVDRLEVHRRKLAEKRQAA